MKSDSIPAQSSTASLISYLLLRAEAQETRQLGEFWGCRQGRGLCWCSVVLWASAVAVRNGEGIMNESPFQPFVGWLGVFFFFQMVCPVWKSPSCEAPGAMSRIGFVTKLSYFCVSHGCVLKLVLVVGNGLFVATGTAGRDFLVPAASFSFFF